MKNRHKYNRYLEDAIAKIAASFLTDSSWGSVSKEPGVSEFIWGLSPLFKADCGSTLEAGGESDIT